MEARSSTLIPQPIKLHAVPTMDGRCGTCKHWEQKIYPSGFVSAMGTCKLITSDASDLAVVDRDFTKGDDPIWLATSREFGCIQHEPNDA